MKLGENIFKLRKDLKLSQEQLAEKSWCHKANNIELGVRWNISKSRAIKITI